MQPSRLLEDLVRPPESQSCALKSGRMQGGDAAFLASSQEAVGFELAAVHHLGMKGESDYNRD